VELRSNTRELRTSLMATTVLVDASAATCNEWLSVVTDYVGLQLNHIAGKFLDHQVRHTMSPDILAYQCRRELSASNRLRHIRFTIHAPESHSL
jgi:hypothetical protein